MPAQASKPEIFTIAVTGPYGPQDEFYPLKKAGHRIRFGPSIMEQKMPLSVDELTRMIQDADVLVPAYRDLITAEILSISPKLRMLSVPFIGVDRIDVEAATRMGILVCNSPCPENFVGVAEAAIGAMLVMLKRIRPIEAKLRGGGWRVPSDYGDMMAGKTVGIIGLGRIGSQVASRFANWGVELIGTDPYVSEERFRQLGVRRVTLDALLNAADIITLHVPLTVETRTMIGQRELGMMKPGCIIVNTARGEVIDEAALAEALSLKVIGGAALDAFATEPLPADSVLRNVDSDRLLITPHCIGQSEAARRANWQKGMTNITSLAIGELPEHILNPDVLRHWAERFGNAVAADATDAV